MVKPIDTLAEVVEYRVSICGRGGGMSSTRSITITFEGIDGKERP